jgi:hypothetical protein
LSPAADDEQVIALRLLLEQLADLTFKLTQLVSELARLVHS